MKYIVTIKVRKQGFKGFLSALFYSAWERQVEVNTHQLRVQADIMDLIDENY